MKFVLSLQGSRMPGIKKITRLPGIDELITKKSGKQYQVRYFLDDGKGQPKLIGITSKTKSFSTIKNIIIYDLKLQPAIVFGMKPTIDKTEFLNFVGEFISTSKFKIPKKIKESREFFNRSISEGISDMMSDLPPEQKMIMQFFAVYAGIIGGIVALLKGKNMIVTIYHWYQERYVSGPAEHAINVHLFQGQKGSEPAFAMFGELTQFIKHIISKRANALIICGPPGMSKTYTLRRTFHFEGLKPGKHYVIEKGSTLGLSSTFSLLYKHRKRILVLDDFDTPLKDEDTVNLLKAITDTYGRRIVSLPREKKLETFEGGRMAGVPEKFEFKGQVIIITNLLKKDIDPALLSRAPAFELIFNAKTIIESIEKMLKFIEPDVSMEMKREVYDYVIKLYKKDPKITVDFRAFKSAVLARVGNLTGWKQMVHIIVGYKGAVLENYLMTLK